MADLSGKERLSFSLEGRKRKKISKGYKERQAEGIRFNGGAVPQSVKDQIMKSIPDQATFFYKLHVDDNGWIYSFISDVENESSREIDIFSKDGKYSYKAELKVPEGHQIRAGGYVFFQDTVYTVMEDPNGELVLIKYRVELPGKGTQE